MADVHAPQDKLMRRCTALATMSFSAVVLVYAGFVYNSIFLKKVLPAVGRQASALPLGLLFNSIFILAAWSFLKAHLTNPGWIPDGWHGFMRKHSGAIRVFVPMPQWQPGKVTYCKHCDKTRPERAHHCHCCDRCVLRFDHHCFWINNCVGFNNHKHFLLVGGYCCLGLCMAIATCIPQLLACVMAIFSFNAADGLVPDGWEGSGVRPSDVFAFLVFGALSSCVCALLSAMLYVHLPRAAVNVTAPEVSYSNMENPFDRGSILNNLEQIFGAFGPDWFFPVQPWERISDGLTFNQRDDPDWLMPEEEEDVDTEGLWRRRYEVQAPPQAEPRDACAPLW